MENNEILCQMFHETPPNISKHNVRCSDKVHKRSDSLPDMVLNQMLDQMLQSFAKVYRVIL